MTGALQRAHNNDIYAKVRRNYVTYILNCKQAGYKYERRIKYSLNNQKTRISHWCGVEKYWFCVHSNRHVLKPAIGLRQSHRIYPYSHRKWFFLNLDTWCDFKYFWNQDFVLSETANGNKSVWKLQGKIYEFDSFWDMFKGGIFTAA